LDVEDPGNVGAGALLDDLVGILKAEAELARQQATNGGLAGPHGADKYDGGRYCVEHGLANESFRHDLGGDEDQQLALALALHGLAEQAAEVGQVAKERHLGNARLLLRLIDTTEHHGFAIGHQHLGFDLGDVDGGNTTGHVDLAHRVLVDHQVHDDVVVRRDLRGNVQLQHGLLEGGGSSTTGRGFLIGNLGTVFDGGLLLVAGDDLGLGDDFRLSGIFQRTQLKVEQNVVGD